MSHSYVVEFFNLIILYGNFYHSVCILILVQYKRKSINFKKCWSKYYKKENLIALAGVYQPAKCIENSKIPIAIELYLKEHKNIKNIILHFDRDMPGRNAAKAFQIVIPKEYIVVDCPVPYGKDINDFLCYKLGLKRTKEFTNNRTTKEQLRD